MSEIVLQFVSGENTGAKLIEWFSQGEVSHVDAVLPGYKGDLLGARSETIGSVPPGVQIRPANYAAWNKVVRVVLPAPEAMVTEFYNSLMPELGKPYDEEAILAFIAGRNWRDPCAWFCSEVIGFKLEACKYFPWPLATPANKLTPAGLMLATSARAQVYI